MKKILFTMLLTLSAGLLVACASPTPEGLTEADVEATIAAALEDAAAEGLSPEDIQATIDAAVAEAEAAGLDEADIQATVVAASSAAEEMDVTSTVVNVYSARHYGAVEGPFARFTEETGIEVRLSQGSTQELLERIRNDAGQDTPNPPVADLFFAIDIGSVALAASEGLLQPVESDILEENIPALLQAEDNQWFAFSQRVRTIMYNSDTVDPEELDISTYADLARPEFAGRLCLRPATHIYTIALTASLVENFGEEEAENIVQGWANNTFRYINSDTRILQTIAAEGGCDIGITNHYYLARGLEAGEPWADLIQPLWANQNEMGVHRNAFAAGVLNGAANADAAILLLEWMATEGQVPDDTGIAASNNEFPVNPAFDPEPFAASLGLPGVDFVIDPIDPATYGSNQSLALDILERTGYGFAETE
ncbi:MAG: extracellular solute-binding protein [Chloroflexi bacterium]|nr:extracellular solute-binding protein [Chloroflexota bacterium]